VTGNILGCSIPSITPLSFNLSVPCGSSELIRVHGKNRSSQPLFGISSAKFYYNLFRSSLTVDDSWPFSARDK
jgi:hypothetical protein